MIKRTQLLLSFALLFSFFAGASERYWVGGTGDWSETKHWSTISGGKGGAGVPHANDNVHFDSHSFSSEGQSVKIAGDASCMNMDWKDVSFYPSFISGSSGKLSIYGSLVFSSFMKNELSGNLFFKGSSQNISITTAGQKFIGDIYFEGNGYWLLQDGLYLSADASLILRKGMLNTYDQEVHAGSFIGTGKEKRGLIPGNSKFIIENNWDISDTTGFYFSSEGNYSLEFKKKNKDQFKSGNFRYKKIILPASNCPPLTLTVTTTPDSCNVPPTNGTATVTVVGGTTPYTYLWNPTGQTTQTATGLGPGGYIVTVTDALGNQCQEVGSVTQPPPIVINVTLVKPLCNGNCNGSITANPIGGTGIFVSYLWNPTAQITQTATGLCANTYTVTVTDSYGCTQQRTVVLTQPAVLAANGSFVDVLCNGQCTGSITAAPSGGTTPYTYLWTPGNFTTASITGLCAPTCHTVTVTDANGCTTTFNHCTTQPPPLTSTQSQVNVQCNGVCIGTATVNPSGGTSPYTYSWNTIPVQTNATATGLCAGNYTCTITDANGCTITKIFIITQPSNLTATQSQVNLLCNSVCIGTATVNPSGGTAPYTYSWNTLPVQTTATATGLCIGNYTCTITDAHGCTITKTFIITQPPPLTALQSQVNPLCFGQCNGTATVVASGGTPNYVYSWNTIPVQATATATGLCAQNYTCTITDANGCTITKIFTITSPTQITATTSQVNVPCFGVCVGTATVNPSGGTPGYTFVWNPGGQTTQTATGLCAGNYTCTITDANGCTITKIFILTQPTLLTVTLSSTPILCNNQCTATLTSNVNGGTAPYTYLWSPGNQNTANITGQCAGSYTLVVTDAHGCTAQAVRNVTQPTALTLATAANPVTCFNQCNGSATAIAGGGNAPYTYSWAPGGQATSTINNQCAGSYTVFVTDANGCQIQQTIVITGPTQLVLGFSSTNVTCNSLCNGTATTNVSGGTAPYTYLWTPGNFTTSSISNLCPGNYSVKVTDANGCIVIHAFTITQPQLLTAVISSSTTACNICNGTATVTPSGGTGPFNYSWTTSPVQTTQTATGLCPGTYTVTITDANGCTTTAVATITLTVVIQITTSGSTLPCFGNCTGVACAIASGGQAPYSYLWSSIPFQTTQCATGLCAGTYTVNITDANGCTGIDSITFTNPPQLFASAVFTSTSCNNACDGTATGNGAGGTGPYSYSWTPGGQTTQTATALCAGSYTLTVTDANGCTATATVNVTQASAILANATVTNANCLLCDGSITIVPSGGTPGYTYLWMPGAFTTPTINNLCPGIYTLTITDAAGCSRIFNITVSNIQGPTVTLSVVNATCNGSCNGSITSTVSGGTAPYTYSWNPGNQLTPNIVSQCAGTYTLWVTDLPGCVTVKVDSILQPLPISPNGVVVNSLCANNCNGSITLTPSGGTPAYTYSWWNNGANTSAINNLCAGIYTVTITDANGCTDSSTYTITQPPVLAAVMSFTNVNCNGACDGTGNATPSGGTGPYTYNWMPGNISTSNDIGLCPGTYTCTITDANGCTVRDSVIITQPTLLTSTFVQTNVSCFNLCNGTSTVTPAGGTPGYTYSWNTGPAQLTQTATGLCAGTFNCYITDAKGCVHIQAVTITQPAQILPNVTQNNVSCNLMCNGTATANPSGGTGPYTFSWSNNALTQTINGLCPGPYTSYVTDANGCVGIQVITITQPQPITANLSVVTQPTCPVSCNGSLTANPSGGTAPYTYLWNPTAQTTQTATGLCVGNYTLTVTDANGCTGQQTFNLSGPVPVSVAFSVAQANCGVCNGSITATPSGGSSPYSYSWVPGNLTTQTISNQCAGLYTLFITDNNGCVSQFTIGLSNTSGGVLTLSSTPVSCFGVCDGSVTVLAAGNGPFNYVWTPSGCTTTTCTALCANTYVVTVTDINSCITIDSVPVTTPSQILDNAVLTNANCIGNCNGAITLGTSGGTGPYTYVWTPNVSTTNSATGLCQGSYAVTITDAGGCSRTFNYTLNGITTINVTTVSSNVNCNGSCTGTATVSNTTGGASPYTYLWNPTAQTTVTATGLCAGTYTVNVTDANGCVGTNTVIITQPPPLVFGVPVVNNPLCNGNANGSITVAPSGGTSPFTYSWSAPGGTSSTLSGLSAGTYTSYVTDANGCLDSAVITLTSPPALIATSGGVTSSSCNTVADGTIQLNVVGGTPAYSYLWTPGNMTTQNLNNVLCGNYTVTVTDLNGCTDTVHFTVPCSISVIAAITGTNTVCVGSCTLLLGTTSVNASTYSWFSIPGMTLLGTNDSLNICPINTGINNYILICANGLCRDTDTIAVTVNPLPVVNAGPDVTILFGTSSSIGGSPTGPNGSTYSWYPGSGLNDGLNDSLLSNPTASPTTTTTYYVLVTDAFGCTSIDSMVVTVLPDIIFPNGISPNGDGANDYWIIDNITLFPDNVVEVYNRWGELLYQGKHYDNNFVKWDGTYKGKSLPVGTYYYIIDLKSEYYPKAFTGPITLMR